VTSGSVFARSASTGSGASEPSGGVAAEIYDTIDVIVALIVFLLVVTPVMHNFWSATDPGTRALQQGMFMKNLAMMGGAILVAYFGAGPWSVDWSVRRT